MNPVTEMRVDRIKRKIEAGYSRDEITRDLAPKLGISPRTMGYYFTLANKELRKDIEERKELVARLRKEKIGEEAKKLIMTELEADACLTEIIRGDRKTEKVVSTKKDGVQVVKVAPRISDIMKAIDWYFRRETTKRNWKEEWLDKKF
jgi:hypothetical protein